MRYTRPQIVGSFNAVSTIQSSKGSVPQEILDATQLTDNPAYQADE